MSNSLDGLYRNQSHIYKYILYTFSVVIIVFFFPKGGKFKYEFQKGKPWQYENLYAPFDFSILKSEEEISAEREAIEADKRAYFTYDETVVADAKAEYAVQFPIMFSGANLSGEQIEILRENGLEFLDQIYTNGIVSRTADFEEGSRTYLVRDNEAVPVNPSQFHRLSDTDRALSNFLEQRGLTPFFTGFQELFFNVLKPNVAFDQDLTERELADALSEMATTRGTVDEGALIIAKGEVVENENLKILNSLKAEFQSELWTESSYYFILSGYLVLVGLALLMLILFIKRFRPEVYRNNVKVTFIFFNIILMVFITTTIVKFNEAYVFIIPLCILPLVLKTFFDARLSLFVHVITVLILGFVVPNTFEFVFLQMAAGIVAVLSVSELYKRANLFISVGQITLIYIIGYFAFHSIQEGGVNGIDWFTYGFFLLNGMITLFAPPLIYISEKMFGMVSDVSLLELSDTNSKLLKALADKAPGTFHHSLQVANLAEAAANEIGANAMLVRVGALYHDIGKMNNPTYFTENQTTAINPHNDLSPVESARIIIKHVIEGIEMAQRNNIPDRIIDFIRVHHGTTKVRYFYKKQEESGEQVNPEDFTYPGPIPFSKETAILMMADSVEAASKSLSNPTFAMIDNFVEKIVSSQMDEQQFSNADITFKEIETVKKVLKQKLTNIYHLRIEYPE